MNNSPFDLDLKLIELNHGDDVGPNTYWTQPGYTYSYACPTYDCWSGSGDEPTP